MSRNFGKRSTAEEVATQFKDEIKGKNIIITGVSPGSLGAEAVRTLAPYAHLIIAAGRSKERTEQTIQDVKKEVPVANIKNLVVDLASLESIRSAAGEVSLYNEPIHVLINNAAVLPPKERMFTKDGFELLFGTHHLGHFLFTNLLMARLKLGSSPSYSPRIINITSNGHLLKGSQIRWDDPNYEKRPSEYSPYEAYGQSKTANILFTVELAKRLAKYNILSYSVHPGGVFTNMGSAVPKADLIALGHMREDGSLVDPEKWKSVSEGTSTHLVAAFDPSIKDQSGSHLLDAQVRNDQRASWASNQEDATRLWELSEELLGEKFVP